jgi:cytochrome b6-f complex iron-sulfur subunit
MNRRDLVQKIALGGAVLFVVPTVLTSCSKASTGDTGQLNPPGTKINIDLTLPAYAALNTAGGSVIVQSIIVAYTGTSYVALSSVCTHQGGTVGYNMASGNFVCPNHGSVFSVGGSVVTGPAATPLDSYQISKSGNILTITV